MRLLTLVAGLALLQGCATMAPDLGTKGVADREVDWPAQVGTAETGAVIDLPASNELGEPTVRVGEPYMAASGRLCRRMTDTGERMISRLVCSDDQRGWYLTRSLSVLLRSQQPVIAAASPASDSAAAESEQIIVLTSAQDNQISSTFELAAGETLWSFSQRVTGDPLNWEAIASHNGITSNVAIPVGAQLTVPQALINAGE